MTLVGNVSGPLLGSLLFLRIRNFAWPRGERGDGQKPPLQFLAPLGGSPREVLGDKAGKEARSGMYPTHPLAPPGPRPQASSPIGTATRGWGLCGGVTDTGAAAPRSPLVKGRPAREAPEPQPHAPPPHPPRVP